MVALNLTRNVILAKELRVARNFFERLRGLIGSPPLQSGEGLLIPHGRGVHTFGMTYPIDVLYLDGDGRVVKVLQELVPNSFGKVDLSSRHVLELPGGTVAGTRTEVGDLLFFYGQGETLGIRADSRFESFSIGSSDMAGKIPDGTCLSL